MHTRAARESDTDSIMALDRIAQTDPGRAEFISNSINSGTCIVAERQDHVLGYGVLEYTFFSNGFISMVYVAEEERRQGIGSTLLNSLAECCHTPKIFTSTNESNLGMQSVLVRSGFIPSGIIYNLDIGDPELVYFKRK